MRRPALRWGPPRASSNLGWPAGDRQSDNGLSEALIVALFQAAPGLGVQRISLNFAVFRSALAHGAGLGAGPVARAWRRLLLLRSRWWQIDQLQRQIRAAVAPAIPVHPTIPTMPRVAVAALRAEAFLVLPGRHSGRERDATGGTAASRPLRARPQIAMPVPIPPPPSHHDDTRRTASRRAAVSSLSTGWAPHVWAPSRRTRERGVTWHGLASLAPGPASSHVQNGRLPPGWLNPLVR